MINNKLKKIFITEDGDRWVLSYNSPEFQGGKSIDIDKETAQEILEAQLEK